MLKKTYDKVCELFEEGNGYLPTRTLLMNIELMKHIPTRTTAIPPIL